MTSVKNSARNPKTSRTLKAKKRKVILFARTSPRKSTIKAPRTLADVRIKGILA